MARRCKNQCGTQLLAAAQCTDIVEKKGYCCIECLDEHTIAKRKAKDSKQKDAEFKVMKDRVNSQGVKSKLMVSTQAAFNAFIRARDEKKGCVSCGTMKAVSGGYTGAGGWDAGHYRSRGATPELRLNEDNCFRQCVKCNRDMSGNVVNMRIEILKRIGQERLDFIEGPHNPNKYTPDDLKDIRQIYKIKLKQLKG